MEKKPKMGRPTKPEAERVTKIVALRLTGEERTECERAAKQADMTLSAWMRALVLKAAKREARQN